jgi:hypothetical protein
MTKTKKTFGEVWCSLTSEQCEYLKDFINKQRQDAVKHYKSEQLRLTDVSHLLIAWEEYKLANMYQSDSINVEKMLMEKFVAIYCG